MRRILLLGLAACVPEAGVSPFDPAHDWDEDGFSEDQGDCDDEDGATSPETPESCSATVDLNCDGRTDPCLVIGEMSVLDGLGGVTGPRPDDTWPVHAAGAVGNDGFPWAITGSIGGYEARVWQYRVTDGQLDGVDQWFLGTSVGDPEISHGAAGGDIDGDGVADVLVASYEPWNSGEGAASVFVGFGPIVGDRHLPIDADSCQWFVPVGDSAGEGLAGGDFDGDGDSDVLIGAPGHGDGVGAVWFVPGGAAHRDCPSAKSLEDIAEGVWEGDFGVDAGVGASVSGIGDVDGDGLEDIAIGSYGTTEPRGMEVFVVLGADGGLNGTRPLSDVGHADYGTIRDGATAQLAAALTRLGDLAVGTAGDDDYSGSAWIVLGVPGEWDVALSDTAQVEINGADAFGATITAGDLDDDGIPDLIVGSPEEDDGAVDQAGAVYLFAGSTLGATGEFYADQHAYAAIRGTTDYGRVGLAAAVLGDVDDDGDDDFVLSERLGSDATSWLFLGGP